MRLWVDVLGNWWVFESLCVSNPLRLWAVCVSTCPPLSAKPRLQAQVRKCVFCTFVRQ